jgi:hypothetical protein
MGEYMVRLRKENSQRAFAYCSKSLLFFADSILSSVMLMTNLSLAIMLAYRFRRFFSRSFRSN